MSRARLTKQELGWLLTQEAKGAAQRLRVGVRELKGSPAAAPAGPLDDTLDTLDDAMRALSSLHGPAAGRGRRGRIDLAALLWEIAPDAHIAIEPGSGTEVSGEESELRRMLQILIGHEAEAGAAVTVKRDGDDVRVSVVLGPDSTATSDTERALLGRMALRYGGRYELEGGAETLVLPAEGVEERSEAAQLRKELEEAKRQGEAYARELAQVVTDDAPPPASVRGGATDTSGPVLRFARGLAGELRSILAGPAQKVARAGADDERIDVARRALSRAQEVVGLLATFGELDPNEPAGAVEIVEALREAARSLASRAARVEVALRVEAEGPVHVRAKPRATDVLLRAVLEHAIAASPRGAEVVARVLPRGSGAELQFDDGGSTLPAAARRPLVDLDIEPGTYGRPSAIPLFVASQLAGWQGVGLDLTDAPQGGVRVSLSLKHGR